MMKFILLGTVLSLLAVAVYATYHLRRGRYGRAIAAALLYLAALAVGYFVLLWGITSM